MQQFNFASATYEFYHSTLWIGDGIMFGTYKPDLIINLQVAKDIVRDRKVVSQGIPRPILMDITNLLTIDSPGRSHLSSTEACEFVIAGAIYTENKLLACVGNLFLLINSPPIPSKVFSDRTLALKWLEPYKNQHSTI